MNTKSTNREMNDGEMRLNRFIYIIFSNILQLYLFFKNYLFSLQSKIYREEERRRGISCVFWFTHQVITPAGAASIQSKEPGTSSTSQGFGLSSTAVPGHNRELDGQAVGLPELEPKAIWDPGVFKARTLATRPTRRARSVFYKVKWINGKKNPI